MTEKAPIQLYDPDDSLKIVLDEIAENMGASRSELAKLIIEDHIDEYKDFNDADTTIKRWIKMRKQKRREKLHRELAQWEQQKSTFIHFMSSQIFSMKQRGAEWNDIRDMIEENSELFVYRNLEHRYEHMLEAPSKYYKAYAKWQRNNEGNDFTAFQLPELGESQQ